MMNNGKMKYFAFLNFGRRFSKKIGVF